MERQFYLQLIKIVSYSKKNVYSRNYRLSHLKVKCEGSQSTRTREHLYVLLLAV